MGHFTTTGVTVYVSCLASYNAAKGWGAWFDLDDSEDLDNLQNKVNAMLQTSPVDNAEEYRIDDYEQLPWVPGSLEQAWAMHELIQEYGEVARAAMSYDHYVDYAEKRCENLCGVHASYEALGDNYLEDFDVPSCIAVHVDAEALGKDYASNYNVVEWGDELYLFGEG